MLIRHTESTVAKIQQKGGVGELKPPQTKQKRKEMHGEPEGRAERQHWVKKSNIWMHVQLTVVVVVISSVTTFSVSTTEMYPRRLAMAKAVLPFWREERGGERAEREGGLWCEPMRSLSTLHEPAFPSKTRHSLGKSRLFYRYIWLCLCNFFKTIAPIAMVTQHTYICQQFQILQHCMV